MYSAVVDTHKTEAYMISCRVYLLLLAPSHSATRQTAFCQEHHPSIIRKHRAYRMPTSIDNYPPSLLTTHARQSQAPRHLIRLPRKTNVPSAIGNSLNALFRTLRLFEKHTSTFASKHTAHMGAPQALEGL